MSKLSCETENVNEKISNPVKDCIRNIVSKKYFTIAIKWEPFDALKHILRNCKKKNVQRINTLRHCEKILYETNLITE